MADSFNWDIIVRFAAQGLKGTSAEISEATKALEDLNTAGKIAPGTFNKVAPAFVRAGKAAENAASGVENATANLPRLRYALYDVSSALTVTGAAMTALGVATFGTAISMDRAFADVARTTGVYLDDTGKSAALLRDEFERLFSTMPVSWGALTEIGTLAGQLNIATGSVDEFTKLVAMFAATTDVSIEQAATAFGRLSQLLNVPSYELENLGSSILAVGVNSIATESQIIAISTQITSMASSAGFSADQVFGLSSALASLGTQPELSRGVITRLFTNINNSILEGSDSLEKFGRAAGMTGAQFAEAWGSDASGTLLRLMEGIGSKEGPQAVATLNELGIVASRDVPTLLRLAQNSDVLAESLSVAAQGYADGSALGEQYGVIATTVAEKLTVLWNNVQLLISSLGGMTGPLGAVVDGLTGMVQWLTELTNNPVAQWSFLVVAGLAALSGVLLVVGGLVTRGLAGIVATRTAYLEYAAAAGTAAAGNKGFLLSLLGIEAGSKRAGTALKAMFWGNIATAVLSAALAAATVVVEKFEKATQSARDKASAFFGDISGFHDAIKADTAIWQETGEAISTFSARLADTSDKTVTAGEATKTWLGIQATVPGGVANPTGAVEEQTFALGENADAWIRNALSQNEAVRQMATNTSALEGFRQLGFNIDTFIAQGLQGQGALDAEFERILAKAQELQNQAGTPVLDQDLQAALAEIGLLYTEYSNLVAAKNEDIAVSQFLGQTTQELTDDYANLAAEMDAAISGFLDAENAAIATESAFSGLGSSLAQNGDDFSYFTEAGRENAGALMAVIKALAAETPGDAAATASNMQALFNFLVEGGLASAQQLSILKGVINSLGQTNVKAADRDFTSFFGGWSSGAQKAEKATRSAGSAMREQVRTLKDYANDLNTVFSRSFEIRFSGGSTLDAITSTFISMREASEEAARNIAKLKAEIQGLESDLNIQQYFLGIAIEYGDTKRAEAIQANIAKLQAELAGKTADLSDEQAKNSKELTGNSKAAIANRKQLEDLVKQYQDHITALASSGMGQAELAQRTAELRQQFLQQTTEMGYNRLEVEKYAAAFDDMGKIIASVPRNITLSVDANPAITALREYEAALDKARANSGRGISAPNITNPTNAREVRRLALEAEILAAAAMLDRLRALGEWTGVRYQMEGLARLRHALASGSYADGGFTGRGGKYEPAGVVHRGEYVIPKEQVNQRTGLPFANALGQLQRGTPGPGYARGGYVGGQSLPGSGQITSLGPMAVQQFSVLFAENMRTYLDGKSIAQNSSQQFAHSTATGAA